MKVEFADSVDQVFETLCAVTHLLGGIKVLDSRNGRITGNVKRGMGAIWEPVTVSCRVTALVDRTAVEVSFDQKQITGIPDMTKKAAQVFAEHLARRKELTRLD